METPYSLIGQVVDLEMEDFIELRIMEKPDWFVCRCFPRLMFDGFQPVELRDYFKITTAMAGGTFVTFIKREPKDPWEALFNKRPTTFDNPDWVAKHDSFFKNDRSLAYNP